MNFVKVGDQHINLDMVTNVFLDHLGVTLISLAIHAQDADPSVIPLRDPEGKAFRDYLDSLSIVIVPEDAAGLKGVAEVPVEGPMDPLTTTASLIGVGAAPPELFTEDNIEDRP